MDENHSLWAPQSGDKPRAPEAAPPVIPPAGVLPIAPQDESAKTTFGEPPPTAPAPPPLVTFAETAAPLSEPATTSPEVGPSWREGLRPVDLPSIPGGAFELKFRPLPNAYKVGILGGTNFGKSYLFQAMAYRLWSGGSAGALAYYRPDCQLWEFPFLPDGTKEDGKPLQLGRFLAPYRTWIPLKNTELSAQKWYCLRTKFKSGWLGGGVSTMDIEFLDGAGEGFERPLGPGTLPTWKKAFSDAQFMIFCLPIWAIFPVERLTAQDRKEREFFLDGFENVLSNYLQIKKEGLRVRTVLVLTMADDKRCSLRLMRDRWIDPFTDSSRTNEFLKQMKGRRGANRYLASARAVSKHLYTHFESSLSDPALQSIPERLDLGMGPPTMIPVTAMEGAVMAPRKAAYFRGAQLEPLSPPPVPAHVELPLLAALCQKYNILM
jgi:hypothetical protein